MIEISAIRDHVIAMLKSGLPKFLKYHNVNHTVDVVTECMVIAKEEKLLNQQALQELQIAALYHDTGFLHLYKGHEEMSCELAIKQLPDFGVSNKQIDNICEIILATKMPQAANSHLQQILCDADLDHLGRDDFFTISETLQQELIEYQIVKSIEEYHESTIAFLKSHSYFTESAKNRRTIKKLEHLKLLRAKILGEL